MTVRVSNPSFNIQVKLKMMDYSHVPYEKMPPGSVVQYQTRTFKNQVYTTASTVMIDVDSVYVDIAPKFASSIIVFRTNFTAVLNDDDGYARYRIVDANQDDQQWSSNLYMGASHYYAGTAPWLEVYVAHRNIAGTTSPMRLTLQVQINSGGTLNMQWSGSDDRLVEAIEIKS